MALVAILLSSSSSSSATGARADASGARYYITSYDGTIYEVLNGTGGQPLPPRALTFSEWTAAGSPTPQPAVTEIEAYPWDPTLYAVTTWATGEQWQPLTPQQWERTGFRAPRPVAFIPGTHYWQWATSAEIVAQAPDGATHVLTYAEWAASGFRAYERRSNQGYVKLYWSDGIAFMSDLANGFGAQVTYSGWSAAGRPTPQTVARITGDAYAKDPSGPGIYYQGPTVSRYVTYAEWVARGRPTPYTGLNGRIDPATLCHLPWQQNIVLRCDAAGGLAPLNAAYTAQFGHALVVDDGYRTYVRQVQLRALLGTVAAVPGTSNHGWGVAIDTPEGADYAFGSPAYDWLQTNGPQYGWVSPAWAQANGGNPEYWHFEYSG